MKYWHGKPCTDAFGLDHLDGDGVPFQIFPRPRHVLDMHHRTGPDRSRGGQLALHREFVAQLERCAHVAPACHQSAMGARRRRQQQGGLVRPADLGRLFQYRREHLCIVIPARADDGKDLIRGGLPRQLALQGAKLAHVLQRDHCLRGKRFYQHDLALFEKGTLCAQQHDHADGLFVPEQGNKQGAAHAAVVHHGTHDGTGGVIQIAFTHVRPNNRPGVQNASGRVRQVRIHRHLPGIEHLHQFRCDVDICSKCLDVIFGRGQDQPRHLRPAQ